MPGTVPNSQVNNLREVIVGRLLEELDAVAVFTGDGRLRRERRIPSGNQISISEVNQVGEAVEVNPGESISAASNSDVSAKTDRDNANVAKPRVVVTAVSRKAYAALTDEDDAETQIDGARISSRVARSLAFACDRAAVRTLSLGAEKPNGITYNSPTAATNPYGVPAYANIWASSGALFKTDRDFGVGKGSGKLASGDNGAVFVVYHPHALMRGYTIEANAEYYRDADRGRDMWYGTVRDGWAVVRDAAVRRGSTAIGRNVAAAKRMTFQMLQEALDDLETNNVDSPNGMYDSASAAFVTVLHPSQLRQLGSYASGAGGGQATGVLTNVSQMIANRAVRDGIVDQAMGTYFVRSNRAVTFAVGA